VLNKCDLAEATTNIARFKERYAALKQPIFVVSSQYDQGIAELKRAIRDNMVVSELLP
jgi:ethanolamine utilization protein EutP (predicted NTPase)